MFAVVWHYWIGLLLAIGSVATIVATAVGYVVKVQAPRYPKGPYPKKPYPKKP
jgi:hypothetical protein